MIAATPGVLALVEEMLPVLNEEIALLTLRRAQLETLSKALIENDDKALERLLAEMEETQQIQADTERKLQALRAALANAVGCDPNRLRLASLMERLDDEHRAMLDYRRQRIILLVKAVRAQHLRTTMHLLESARINRMLLEGLFPRTQSVGTYDVHGSSCWHPDGGLVDAEL